MRKEKKRTPELQEAMAKIFLRSMSILRAEKKLGVLLLQLSPAFSPAKHELRELTPLLDMFSGYRLAIELRNRNWAIGEQLSSTIDFLRKRETIFVNVDAPTVEHFTILPPELNEITNRRVAYLRLHGRDARAYLTGKTVAARFNYDYSDREVEEIGQRTRKLAREAQEVHVVFNNNALDYAPHAALRLRKALGQIVATAPETLELF